MYELCIAVRIYCNIYWSVIKRHSFPFLIGVGCWLFKNYIYSGFDWLYMYVHVFYTTCFEHTCAYAYSELLYIAFCLSFHLPVWLLLKLSLARNYYTGNAFCTEKIVHIWIHVLEVQAEYMYTSVELISVGKHMPRIESITSPFHENSY